MIADNGVVGTLAKLIEHPTEGLEFLAGKKKLDLAAETIVLDKRFALVISDEMRAKAARNLAMIEAAIAHGKKDLEQAMNDNKNKTDACGGFARSASTSSKDQAGAGSTLIGARTMRT